MIEKKRSRRWRRKKMIKMKRSRMWRRRRKKMRKCR